MSRTLEKDETRIVLESVVHCPKCGFESPEIMPSDFCLIRYQCKNCGFVMIPTEGKCCIFCSYGSMPCPPIQGMKVSGLED